MKTVYDRETVRVAVAMVKAQLRDDPRSADLAFDGAADSRAVVRLLALWVSETLCRLAVLGNGDSWPDEVLAQVATRVGLEGQDRAL